jgi:hypothetical protein
VAIIVCQFGSAQPRGTGVDLAEEFRARAGECFRWSKEARSIADQVRWLNMAQFWLRLAQHAEEQEAMRSADPSSKSEDIGNGEQTSGPSDSSN